MRFCDWVKALISEISTFIKKQPGPLNSKVCQSFCFSLLKSVNENRTEFISALFMNGFWTRKIKIFCDGWLWGLFKMVISTEWRRAFGKTGEKRLWISASLWYHLWVIWENVLLSQTAVASENNLIKSSICVHFLLFNHSPKENHLLCIHVFKNLVRNIGKSLNTQIRKGLARPLHASGDDSIDTQKEHTYHHNEPQMSPSEKNITYSIE